MEPIVIESEHVPEIVLKAGVHSDSFAQIQQLMDGKITDVVLVEEQSAIDLIEALKKYFNL